MLLLIYLTPMWAWGYEIQCILRATLMCILRATLMELLIRKYCKFDTFKIKIYATSLPKLYRLNVFFSLCIGKIGLPILMYLCGNFNMIFRN